ncbi:MAG: hypothetical protein Q7U60_00055 [Candidatus Methanoperedens sp.]|nr:hypothetical protein [Candidatus Methanoperedens sp.]
MRILTALVLIALTAGAGSAERLWINNITVDESNMVWGYTETFTGADAIAYRIDIDKEFGDNDSFINAWELLKTDKEMRKKLRSAIDNEFDVRINTPETPYLNTGTNWNSGIEVVDVDSSLSSGIIGKTHIEDTIVNRYRVTYRWKESIFNASSIWFLGQAKSPVEIILPEGIDVTNISGMDNVTKNMGARTGITGFFTEISVDRGEITLNLTRNTSMAAQPQVNATNVTSTGENITKPVTEIASKIRDMSLLIAGIALILVIYIFKVRKRQYS